MEALLKLGDVYFNGYGGIEIDYTRAAEQVRRMLLLFENLNSHALIATFCLQYQLAAGRVGNHQSQVFE